MDKGKVKFAIKIAALVAVIMAVIYIIANFIYYAGIKRTIYVELGDSLPTAASFLKDDGEIKYITDISGIDESVIGKYKVQVDYNGKEKNVYIVIEDTTPPKVVLKNMEISIYQTLAAKDLIVRVDDKSKVKIEYAKEPSYGNVGSYEAVVKVTDEAGNVTKAVSNVNICRVNDYVEYVYGEAFPVAEDFVFSEKDKGRLVTDLEATVNKPGTYYVTIEIDGKNYKSKLIAVDNDAPVVVGKDAEISLDDIDSGNTLMPNDFVYSFYDRDDVTIYFLDQPDYSSKKDTKVRVAVSDTSGNTTIIERTMYVVKYKGFDIAIGSEGVTDGVLTSKLDCKQASWVSGTVNTDKLGRYPVTVNVDGEDRNIIITVVDTDAPSAKPVKVSLDKKQKIEASMFVSDVEDMSKVTIAFENEPDATYRGIQDVRVILKDEAGNFFYVDTTLEILYDAIKPQLFGVAGVTTYIRQEPDYMLGVWATDDVDGDIEVTVDDSKVDYEVPGIYNVTYKAVDSSGNVATDTTNVEVKNVDRELVDSMADDIIAGIVNDSMDITDKAWACYNYIQENVRYINQADQSSIEKAAYDGLTLGVGDCYTFAALVEVFMERIGGDTVFVSRSTGGNHYWMLCNLGTGWYHMDATPRNSEFKCFMKTDAEVLAELARYWVYDKSLYPAVETKIYE